MTIPEYELLMEAAKLKQIDKDYRNHLQAWLNFVVQAEKRAGKGKTKPVYTKFKQFYDYNEALDKNKNKGKGEKFSGIGRLLKKGE